MEREEDKGEADARLEGKMHAVKERDRSGGKRR